MAKVTQITTCNQITTCPNWGINNAEDYPWTQADELKQQKTTPGVSPVILEQETETIIYTGSPKLDKRRLEERTSAVTIVWLAQKQHETTVPFDQRLRVGEVVLGGYILGKKALGP